MSVMGKGLVVKLRHPGSDNVLSFVATEDGKLDIGTVARGFGLDPASVKLNGHFVSRGMDFISSVTWKALLGCFARKGYSTGKNDQDAILVEGVPCSSDYAGAWTNDNHLEQLSLQKAEDNGHDAKRRMQVEDLAIFNMLRKRKKLQHDLVSTSGGQDADSQANNNRLEDSTLYQAKCNDHDIKRRGFQDEFGVVHAVKKRMRLQDDSETFPATWMKSSEQISQNNCFNATCNKDTKRMRPDDMLVESPCKRVK